MVGRDTFIQLYNDVNLCFTDLAVGAPYGGREGKGAIYIYHGSMKGILTQVSQVLHISLALIMYSICSRDCMVVLTTSVLCNQCLSLLIL